ncbi:MAG: VOC family protein [Betaproteobacteria bacterium]
MEAQELHRGRLIDHIQLVVRDLAASKRFYSAAFQVLGIPVGGESKEHFWFDELFISTKDSREARWWTPSTRLAAGGRDNGKPGKRPYHPGYYACFVLDPDGNNIEAVFHGPARRSADSVRIDFEA